MKKFIILIFLLLCFGILAHTNPVMTAFFSEIYFDDNNEWSIELYDYYQGGIYTLDGCYIESTTNMACFNNGIIFTSNDTLVVTNADMQTDLIINREGDFLVMGGYAYDEICWGDYSNLINAPYPGQSLVRIVPYYDYFLLAKENQPSLGYNPFDVKTFGGIQGFTMDGYGNLIGDVQVSISSPISYSIIYTDENGYFYIDSLYALNYTLSAYKVGYPSVEMDVTVEPDSITSISFLLVPQSANPNPQENRLSLSNNPNPFYEQTDIHYSLPHNLAGTITIFNGKGQKIKEIPVSPNETSTTWSVLDENNKKVPSGVYFYNLECENKTLASGKMLYLR